jgi:phosphatidylserine/phosphatidylglycerophosphate/cardiolipin synthase-like enzyme
MFSKNISNLAMEEILTRGCRSFFEDKTIQNLSSRSAEANRLIWAGRQNIPATIISALESARISVAATVNQVNQPEVLQAFEGITGIPSMLYVGELAPNDTVSKIYQRIKMPEVSPHAKAISIDNKILFWGTGNFTTNGLNSLREIFLSTSDPLVIKAFTDYYQEISTGDQPQ